MCHSSEGSRCDIVIQQILSGMSCIEKKETSTSIHHRSIDYSPQPTKPAGSKRVKRKKRKENSPPQSSSNTLIIKKPPSLTTHHHHHHHQKKDKIR